MRTKVVAGNWKMNITPSESEKLVKDLAAQIAQADAEVVVCVPAIDIVPVVKATEGSNIKVGAENMYYEESGAFTGELSPQMLTDAGASYVIIGHSERRQYFMEDDKMVNRKVRKALEHNIVPIVCCGETIEQRQMGITLEFIKQQIVYAFAQITAEQAKKCIIAYEPIWAIGTGHVATTAQAQEVCEAIRRDVKALYGDEVAEEMRILYGGSVNAGNAAELFGQPDIDGGLVGGASLKPEFAKIVNYNK